MPEHDDDEVGHARIGWRLDALDVWRTDVDRWRGTVDGSLKLLLTEREIDERVKAQLRRERALILSVPQKLIAAVVGGLAVVASIHGLLQ